jgi:hypothetical protein
MQAFDWAYGKAVDGMPGFFRRRRDGGRARREHATVGEAGDTSLSAGHSRDTNF